MVDIRSIIFLFYFFTEINIDIGYLQNRFGWHQKNVVIESHTADIILFKGVMINGKIRGKFLKS